MGRLRAWVVSAALLLPVASWANAPQGTIRSFFSALEQHDFGRALSFTEGAAAHIIGRLIATINREAAANHAEVELKVKSLRLSEHAADASGKIPVEVSYDIEVIGKKWMLRWPARRLTGTASFYVSDAPRIVAIVGQLN